MSLVTYPESDDDENNVEDDEVTLTLPPSTSLKRKNEPDAVKFRRVKSKPPPSLPPGFHTLYATNVRTSINDDPSLHGGRQRQIPHLVGSWPSFIYLEWMPSEGDLKKLEDILKVAATQHNESTSVDSDIKINSFLRSDLNVRLPLHVSLSSPLILTTEKKDAVEECLTKAIRETNISPFTVTPLGFRWVSNFDKSRYFLILVLAQPKKDELNRLLSTCNQVCQSFHLPQLYTNSKLAGISNSALADDSSATCPQQLITADDKFHISIGWKLQHSMAEDYDSLLDLMVNNLQIGFNHLLIKIGNNVSKVSFGDAANAIPQKE